MKIIAHVNRKSVYISLIFLTIVVSSLIYSHLFSLTFRNGLYFNIFGEALPYVGYILYIMSAHYVASMLWSDQSYLVSDSVSLIEFKGSRINLSEIIDVKVTRKELGIKNITILGKYKTINIRSHFVQEDAEYIVKIIKAEAKLPSDA